MKWPTFRYHTAVFVFWSWRTNQREKAWQILYKTVTSVFFCSSLGPEEADFTLSCQCFSSFSFLPLKIHNFLENMKMQSKAVLFFFFLLFYFISCLLVYLQGDLDQRLHSWCIKVFTGGLKTEKQELQSIQTRKKKKQTRAFPKNQRSLWSGRAGVCGCRHDRLPLGGLLPGDSLIDPSPLMWSSPVTGHLGGFQVCWEFSAFRLSAWNCC